MQSAQRDRPRRNL